MSSTSDIDTKMSSAQSTSDNVVPRPAVTMFGKMIAFTRIKVETADLKSVEQHLATLMNTKTSQIPVVIDSDIELDLAALVDLFWAWGLQPIGVVAGALDDDAKALRLAIFPADGKRVQRIKPIKKVVALNTLSQDTTTQNTHSDDSNDVNKAEVDNIEAGTIGDTTHTEVVFDSADYFEDKVSSLIYDQMLRSGQSINHVGGDLIVTASVNNGAEAISDNCLHVYGRAQGRLVAGATGDKDARIFCQRFNPSLVSVAGTYCLNDSIPSEYINQPVQVSFKEGEGLVFELLNNS